MSTVERKLIRFQEDDPIELMVVVKLSEARVLAQGSIVLLDRFQTQGKSVLMIPIDPKTEMFNSKINTLSKMTELSEVLGKCKNELLGMPPESSSRIACYEVENKFASHMREI